MEPQNIQFFRGGCSPLQLSTEYNEPLLFCRLFYYLVQFKRAKFNYLVKNHTLQPLHNGTGFSMFIQKFFM